MTPAVPQEREPIDCCESCGILLACIDWLTDCTGEGLDGEDAALVEQIRADIASPPPSATPTDLIAALARQSLRAG